MAYIGAAERLARRCEKVGWRVEERRGVGWKVHVPMGIPQVIHRTPKGRGYFKSMEKKFDEAGLSKIEAQLADLKEKERKERIAEDRAKNDELSKKAQRENLLLLRATYAGLSYTDDLSWALKAHETMQNPRVMEVAPEMAASMMERNTDNRPISKSEVGKLRRTQERGDWALTHEAIAFDTRGILQDGQNRLKAIMESGVTCPVWVFVGMPVSNKNIVNRARRRNAGNALFQAGYKDVGNRGASYIRLVIAAQNGDINSRHRPRYDDDEILRMWEADPEMHADCFYRGVRIAKTEAKLAKDGLFVYSAMAAAIYLIKKECDRKHWEYIDRWFDQIEGGYGLNYDDPRARLRRYMQNNRKQKGFDNRGQLILIVDTWNNALSGETPTNPRWSKDRLFPRITRMA